MSTLAAVLATALLYSAVLAICTISASHQMCDITFATIVNYIGALAAVATFIGVTITLAIVGLGAL